MIIKNLITILIFTFLFLLAEINFAQESKEVKFEDKPQARLIEVFEEKTNSEERSRGIDALMVEIENNKNSKGAIIVYCGKVCQYGEVEAHIRGIKAKLSYRRFPLDKLFIINGSYQEKQQTQLWLIPENACPPIPESTIKIEDVKFNGTKKSKFVPYDCCE